MMSLESLEKPAGDTLAQEFKDQLQVASKIINEKGTPEEIKSFEQLSDKEFARLLGECISKLTEGSNVYQYKIGGDFVDEKGGSRNRIMTKMNIQEYEEQYPFLKYFAVKFVPLEDNIEQEVKRQKEIAEKVETLPNATLRVPRIVTNISTPENKVIVVERLGLESPSGSLQNFIESRKGKRNFVISDDIGSRIEKSMEELHTLGYMHGDINDGNFYIENAEIRTMETMHNNRKIKLDVLLGGDLYVIDFERTTPAGSDDFENENEEIESMLKPIEINLDENMTEEELAEEYEELLERRSA